ncbi:MAG: PepSY-like domain-containing protein [Bacteroidota bacterium]
MKKTTIMIAAVLFSTLTFAQETHEKDIPAKGVPAKVKEALQKQFPNAKEVKWEKENDKYEAAFDLNKADYSALFDVDGNLIETEVEIKLSELPNGVLAYIKTKYTGQKVKEAAKITDAKGTVTYEAEIKGKDLLFDSNGQFIKEIHD